MLAKVFSKLFFYYCRYLCILFPACLLSWCQWQWLVLNHQPLDDEVFVLMCFAILSLFLQEKYVGFQLNLLIWVSLAGQGIFQVIFYYCRYLCILFLTCLLSLCQWQGLVLNPQPWDDSVFVLRYFAYLSLIKTSLITLNLIVTTSHLKCYYGTASF